MIPAMCRVFGFRSAFPSAVHHSLVRARNALTVQSREHPDGWGIACFEDENPRLVRGTGPAFDDGDFSEAAGMVSSATVVAHVRKASCGPISVQNTHPFVRGRWIFAHNGDIARWAEVSGDVDARIAPRFLQTLEGETDSERCFLLFLTRLEARAGGALDRDDIPFDAVAGALLDTAGILRDLADPGAEKPSVLTFVVSNGPLLAAIHSGNTLWYSTHKVRCAEREGCAFYARLCEMSASEGDPIRHLLVASEPLSTENVWNPVPDDGVVGVDAAMRLRLVGGASPAASGIPRPATGMGI
jgi:glutamine amidotransferase